MIFIRHSTAYPHSADNNPVCGSRWRDPDPSQAFCRKTTDMNAQNPARNALRHGCCSSVFIARENAEHVSRIHLELVQTYQPALPEEFQIIDDLALARFKVYENQKLMHQRATEEKAQAATLFNHQNRTAHTRTVAEWRKEPALNLPFLTADPLGIDLLLEIWTNLAAALQENARTVSLTQTCDAALALGSHWQVQKIGHHGRRLIGLYLAMHPNPEQQIEHWVEISKGDNQASDTHLAHEIYALAPSPELARAELTKIAHAEIERLRHLKKSVDTLYAARQEQYVAKSCGLGLTDPTRQTEARLFLRYYYAEQNRADKLQNRLEQLNRGLNQHRKEKALAENRLKEAIRSKTESPFKQDLPLSTEHRSAVRKLQSDDILYRADFDISNAALLNTIPADDVTDFISAGDSITATAPATSPADTDKTASASQSLPFPSPKPTRPELSGRFHEGFARPA